MISQLKAELSELSFSVLRTRSSEATRELRRPLGLARRGLKRASLTLATPTHPPSRPFLMADSEVEEEDFIEMDSPEEEPADLIDDSDLIADLHFPPGMGPPSPVNLKTGATRKRKLAQPKEKPRTEQLVHQQSLPYAVESLEYADGQLEFILSRLLDCVTAKD